MRVGGCGVSHDMVWGWRSRRLFIPAWGLVATAVAYTSVGVGWRKGGMDPPPEVEQAGQVVA